MRPLLIGLLATLACAAPSGNNTSTGGSSSSAKDSVTVELGIGESVEVRDGQVRLTLTGVPQDSRCPSDVTCIWEGEGTVALAVRVGDRDTVLQLNTRNEQVASFRDVGVRLVRLSPYPSTKDTPGPRPYRAALTVLP